MRRRSSSARFELSQERIASVTAEAVAAGKSEPTFVVCVTDTEGQAVAEIDKLLYVRPKRR